MLKSILKSMSWKHQRSKARSFVKFILLLPFAKLTYDFIDSKLPTSLRIFRFSQTLNQGRNPLNPPLPCYLENTQQCEEQILLRNKVMVESSIDDKTFYYETVGRDYPIRENPDMIDWVIHYANQNKIKQYKYLEAARNIQKSGESVSSINQFIRQLQQYRYQDLDSVFVPRL